jgi:hypothetical protein
VTGGRPDGTAVEGNAKGVVGSLDLDPLIEPSPQLRPHGAVRRLGWIERLILGNVVEQIAHVSKMGRNDETFNVAISTSLASLRTDLVGACAFNDDSRPQPDRNEREGE